MSGHVAESARLRHRCARPPTQSTSAAPSRPQSIPINIHTNCWTPTYSSKMRRALRRVCSPRRGIHSGTRQHALAPARVCRKRLRLPSARLRRDPIVHLGCPEERTARTSLFYFAVVTRFGNLRLAGPAAVAQAVGLATKSKDNEIRHRVLLHFGRSTASG